MTLVEKDHAGGVCLNRGCIPSKTLLSIGKKYYELKNSAAFSSAAAQVSAQSVWDEMKREKNRVIQQLRGDLEKSLKLSGVKIVQGEAKFSSQKSFQIRAAGGNSEAIFDKAIVAVGSAPFFPPPTNQFLDQVLDSDRIFEIERVPKSIAIVGGGAVGCEFACLFNALGTEVSIIEKTGGLIPGEDAMVVQALRKSYEARGIKVIDSVTITQLNFLNGGWDIALSTDTRLKAEQLLVCAGRRPDFKNIEPEKAGIKLNARGIETSNQLQSSNPDVYFAGDVTGLSLLAHAGAVQGECAAKNALGGSQAYDGSLVPRCLYSWPEVASVGAWKEQAEASGIPVKGQRFFFQASGRALADHQTEGFIQILSHKETDKIIGAQIIGPSATEIIHIAALAIHKQMTRAELAEVIFAHPTFSEGIRNAVLR